MKKMVDELVYEVRSNTSTKRISSNTTVIDSITKQSVNPKTQTKKTKSKEVAHKTCPKCKKGTLLKGSAAFGCSEYKVGCNFKIPFEIYGKKVSENQLLRLIDKGCTTNLKGFKSDAGSVEGLIRFDDDFNLKLEPKQKIITSETKKSVLQPEKISCPKCKKGTILRGSTAYGCSDYKTGCDFRFTFENLKKIANGKPLTKESVIKILNG
jgi:DNA topoisomerase-3